MVEKLERLAAAGIQLAPLADLATYFVFERDGFVALVERTKEDGFGRIGSAGLLTDHGFAALIHRGNGAFFVTKGFEQAATAEQVEKLRRFAEDLEAAIR